MKLGIIGSGKIVKEVLPVLKGIDCIDIVAITARNEEKLKALSDDYDINKYYLDIDELLKDSEVEVVYIALPNELHFEAMKKAIEAGKDIICEKPFTSNAYETEKIIELADKKGVIVLEALTNRFIPNAVKVKELLPELGDIKIVSFNYSQYSSRYDNFKKDIIEPVFSLEHSGGALMDLNLYNVAYVVELFGMPKDVKYFPNIEKDIDTSGILAMDYGNFKAVCIGSKDSQAPLINTIQGTDASIEIPDALNSFSEFNLTKVSDKKTDNYSYNDENKSRLYYEFIEFEEILRNKDIDKADKLLESTKNYMQVLTRARFDANIYYPADKII
ncbi:Gfo/Idh/MocA family protein [uncultured Anaerococcus sp.]|uniref:Gfo/Idh/MocA family protein n=1 Tax=uncultured Anaerococcus sp. TaxID=293428 RepID=UPI00262D7806|nr:Gfo/Idh/MocA family oxidoreductase [uncultured Anaerococcus sp.]